MLLQLNLKEAVGRISLFPCFAANGRDATVQGSENMHRKVEKEIIALRSKVKALREENKKLKVTIVSFLLWLLTYFLPRGS